ncbi:hypothetical protein LP415_24305 [Polaromonas sp. P1(28)-8]|nr:hypothetical protein LP415_24305 [Polaromonas sp. P1(28)-8]
MTRQQGFKPDVHPDYFGHAVVGEQTPEGRQVALQQGRIQCVRTEHLGQRHVFRHEIAMKINGDIVFSRNVCQQQEQRVIRRDIFVGMPGAHGRYGQMQY